ncbi:MEDS domain-containing protein [Actinoplanes aureus]|uniref:MEDS domain-containing protein n=1 Tax=Actinoplanes aureus TaxID=2792083 RepID=A0A931G3P0_9ACTN|nr:MEDS domain-containing protein [Actinoplanes aureus]MBG0564449.1 MEDS domain-containing protein [Actinoplanes aureus]
MLAIQPGDHISATFAAEAQFAGNTIRFAEQAVAASALVMVFPGGPHRSCFQHRLGASSPVIAGAVRSGQVQIADSRQVQLAPGRFDPAYLNEAYAGATRQAVDAGFSGLWVSVDMTWAAGVDPDALTDFEAESAGLFTSRELTAICQYDTRVFPAKQVAAACRAHPAGVQDRSPLRHRRTGRTLRLSGETDLANSLAFAALARTLRPGDVLDITAMTFLDVRALATIVRGYTELTGLTIRASRDQIELLDLIRAGDGIPSRSDQP